MLEKKIVSLPEGIQLVRERIHRRQKWEEGRNLAVYGAPEAGTRRLFEQAVQVVDPITSWVLDFERMGSGVSDNNQGSKKANDPSDPDAYGSVIDMLFRESGADGSLPPDRVLVYCPGREGVGAAFSHLERTRLLPLVEDGVPLLVVSENTGSKYRQFKVRRTMEEVQLGPMNFEETRLYVGMLVNTEHGNRSDKFSDHLIQNMHELTLGYPGLLAVVCIGLDNETNRNGIALRLQEYFTEVVVPKMVEGGDDDVEGALLRVLPYFREFDIHLLGHICEGYLGRRFSNSRLFMTIKRFLSSGCARWSNDKKSNEMEILAPYAQVLRELDPKDSLNVHRNAEQYYANHIDVTPQVRDRWIPEWMFHRVHCDILNGKDLSDVPNAVRTLIDRHYFSPDRRDRDTQGLIALKSRLEKDADLNRMVPDMMREVKTLISEMTR